MSDPVPPVPPVPPELVNFLEAMLEDADLRAWFESFAFELPERRTATFLQIAAEMKEAGEHPEIITATVAVADEGAYGAMLSALQAAAEKAED